MQRVVPLLLLGLCGLMMNTPLPVAAAPGFRVQVQDENGKLLHTSRTVTLGRGRVGIVDEAFQKAGLFMKRELKARRVSLGIHNSDSGVIFPAGRRQVLDFLHERPSPKHYDYPVSVLRGGRFYISAQIAFTAFPDVFSTRIDNKAGLIILRRKPGSGPLPDGTQLPAEG